MRHRVNVMSSVHCQLPPFCDNGKPEPRKALRTSAATQQRKTAANKPAASCRVIAIVTLRRSARRWPWRKWNEMFWEEPLEPLSVQYSDEVSNNYELPSTFAHSSDGASSCCVKFAKCHVEGWQRRVFLAVNLFTPQFMYVTFSNSLPVSP